MCDSFMFFSNFDVVNYTDDNGSLDKRKQRDQINVFLISIHFLQGWAATTGHGVTSKYKWQKGKAYKTVY